MVKQERARKLTLREAPISRAKFWRSPNASRRCFVVVEWSGKRAELVFSGSQHAPRVGAWPRHDVYFTAAAARARAITGCARTLTPTQTYVGRYPCILVISRKPHGTIECIKPCLVSSHTCWRHAHSQPKPSTPYKSCRSAAHFCRWTPSVTAWRRPRSRR